MEEPVGMPGTTLERQAGFCLLNFVVAMAIVSGILLIASSTFGARAPSVHPAVLALEAAIIEARSIAIMQQADGTDAGLPTGATVSVEVDPINKGRSIITVYRSRPIPNPNLPIYASSELTSALPVDTGFPRQTVPAVFTVKQIGNGTQPGTFSILISSSGYTSIEPNAYVPGMVFEPPDPGCSDAGTVIAAASGSYVEAHPFVCRNASYDASAPM